MEHAGVTTVLTGERSKCRPITSLPLPQRKLSVKFISFPRKCRETCRSVVTQRMSSQETLSDREGISSGHQPVLGKDETLFSFSDPERSCEIGS